MLKRVVVILKNSQRSNFNSQQDILVDIDSADINEFYSIEYQELIDNISKILKLNRLSNLLLLCIFLTERPVVIVMPVVGIIMKFIIHRYGKIELDYRLDEYMLNKYL
ncbi:hypothetical protein UT300001_21320 [Clostridium sp. CTA-1]